ncbi:hypothetical protein KC19_7G154600 [Ceratodon purpureus]|uniref:Uncharacterized protein n=2 Tax=Ceratodon purpureus TaxID=3225 RepID=A0A8T0HA23_CERPU|nr:hypothetical protein KC19_7G154600 [Ceratodon purpureus]
MAGIYVRSDAGTEFSPPSRKRRICETNVDMDRIKQESAHLDSMGALSSPTAPSGTLLERLSQLEQHKYSPRGLAADWHSPSSPSSLFSSPGTPSSLERRCRSVKSVLLETEAKGTLVERIQRLEKRISQHSIDVEKAFSSQRFSSSRSEPRHGEFAHVREDPAHLESATHNGSRSEVQETGNSQETYGNNLELQAVFFPIHKSREFEGILCGIKVLPTPNFQWEKHGSSTETKQLTEHAATRVIDPKLEDEPSTPSPTAEAETEGVPERSAGATEDFEAESAGKTMNDKNAVRISKFEETPASEMSTSTDLASKNVPTEALETEQVDEKNVTDETKEQPSTKPTVNLVQNEYRIRKDGGVAKDLIHFRSPDEPLGKFETDFVKVSSPVPVKEKDDKPNEQSQALALVTAQVPEYAIPFLKKEMRRKQSFKHIRERIQRFFGLKEPGTSPTKDASRLHGFGSKETDSPTKNTSRLHRFGSKETRLVPKLGSTGSHRFGSKETNSVTKGTSRPHRFGSSIL